MEISLCGHCVHYLSDLECLAFPDGIPEEILTGGSDHSDPLPGQENDIVFEEINPDSKTQ